MDTRNKHSLWIVPKGKQGQKIQNFINELADRYGAPRFVPHLTLIANIFTESTVELENTKAKIDELAQSIGKFNITLSGFDYTDEEFRCLFLLAEPSNEIDTAYQKASELFPQVNDEHFRKLPHLSILYGAYDSTLKDSIIDEFQDSDVANSTFEVDSFDLFLTNPPIESWQLSKEFPLAILEV